MLDTLEAITGDLADIDGSNAKDVREEMLQWYEEGKRTRHKCLGCETCLPIEPYNQFSKLIMGISTTVQDKGLFSIVSSSCGCGHSCEPETKQEDIEKWPVVEATIR